MTFSAEPYLFLKLYNALRGSWFSFEMVCEYCEEEDSGKLGMRSRVVNGEVETVEICSWCLWNRLIVKI